MSESTGPDQAILEGVQTVIRIDEIKTKLKNIVQPLAQTNPLVKALFDDAPARDGIFSAVAIAFDDMTHEQGPQPEQESASEAATTIFQILARSNVIQSIDNAQTREIIRRSSQMILRSDLADMQHDPDEPVKYRGMLCSALRSLDFTVESPPYSTKVPMAQVTDNRNPS